MRNLSIIPKFYRQKKSVAFPIGRSYNRWFSIPDQQEAHVLITGGTGTGKTTCVLIPLLLNTNLPSFAIDVKGDLAQILQEKGAKFRVLDVRGTGWGYNPFAFVRRETIRSDIGLVVQSIIPRKPEDDFWVDSARQLLQGLLAHYFLFGDSFSKAVLTVLSSDLQQQVKQAVACQREEILTLLGTMVKLNDRTFTCISSTLSASLTAFAESEIQRTLSISPYRCISPGDLLAGENIILRIPEEKLDLYSGFLQLVINQFFQFFETQPDGHQPKVNFVLDEFYRIGKLDSVQKAAATLRSKGVRVIACCQSFAQLEELYGEKGARILADNFSFQIILGAHDPNTQRYYSQKAGKVKTRRESVTHHGGQVTSSVHWEDVPAIQPEEFSLLRERNELVIFFPQGWMRLKKRPCYYKPPLTRLKERFSGKPPSHCVGGVDSEERNWLASYQPQAAASLGSADPKPQKEITKGGKDHDTSKSQTQQGGDRSANTGGTQNVGLSTIPKPRQKPRRLSRTAAQL